MLDRLVGNDGAFSIASDSHKVWPTKAGRAEIQFLNTVSDVKDVTDQFPAKEGRKLIERPLMIQAYLYLYHACLAFMREVDLDDAVTPETEQTYSDRLVHMVRKNNEIVEVESDKALNPIRAEQLYEILDKLVQIMTLTLEAEDDPQVIFETLNARGEPLLASDLIRNFVFLEVARKQEPVDYLYTQYWSLFDEQEEKSQVTANRYWRVKERQGRIN